MTVSTAPIDDSPTRRKRPFGVNAIIALSALLVVFSFAAVGILYFDATSIVPSVVQLEVERWLMFYLIGTSVVQIAIIIGLWRLKRWGWFLVMLHTGIGMFLNIWAYFYAQPNYFAMAASVLIVLYMNQREVQQAFMTEPQGPPQ